MEGSGAPATASARPLDEVMLAMDVVDTLRHRQLVVEQELGSENRDEAMLDRLRAIYAAQGIDVPDRILHEGVAALREERFAYRPPPRSLATYLATVYVRRARYGAALAAVALVAALAWGVREATVVAPERALHRDLEQSYARVIDVAAGDAARTRAEALWSAAQDAIARGDAADARAALGSLEELRVQLEQAYVLWIVAGADAVSGVWRVPDLNPDARSYYLIVEALDASGRPVTVPVRNEETGQVERVSTWGMRVDEATFERVARDKLDDGIIQDRFFGEKRRGELEPDYAFETTGGAITRW
jgi:hypothetical protein